MSIHTNRSSQADGIPPASPTPKQIWEMRTIAGHTQSEAASVIHGSKRAWQNYETSPELPSHRKMPAAAWELYLRRCQDAGINLPKQYADYLNKVRGYRFDPQGPWKIYWGNRPVPGEILGTITRPRGDTGALIRTSSGILVQGNAGAIRSIDQNAISKLLPHIR